MAYTDLSATFVYKGLLTHQQMDGLGENDKYFQTGNAVPTGNWVPTGDWTFTPDGATIPLSIDQDNDAGSIYIDTEATTTAPAIDIDCKFGVFVEQDIDDGYALWCVRNQNDAGTFPLAYFKEDHVNSTQNVVEIFNDGKGLAFEAISTYAGAIHACVDIFADGNSNNAYGMVIRAGTDDGGGVSHLIDFAEGDGNVVGFITHTGGAVTYACLMGHPSFVKDDKKYPLGTVMIAKATGISKHWYKKRWDKQPHEPECDVEPSFEAKDSKVFGVYGGGKVDKKRFQIYTIGRSFILVCKEGGNIKNGDYLTTSNKEGHAMKQDDDLQHSYTVAKSLDDVDWKKEKKNTKLVACTLHAA